jgi:hypothetical protein
LPYVESETFGHRLRRGQETRAERQDSKRKIKIRIKSKIMTES